MPFLDSDHEIIKRSGVTIPTIFDLEGEVGFRRREAAVIESLLGEPAKVLATGGGAVQNPEVRDALRRHGWVVYLDVPVRQLYERTRHDANRPLLRVPNPLEKLEELRVVRDPLYREVADFVLDGARFHSGAAVNRILKEWDKASAQFK